MASPLNVQRAERGNSRTRSLQVRGLAGLFHKCVRYATNAESWDRIFSAERMSSNLSESNSAESPHQLGEKVLIPSIAPSTR